jgi:deazaflavin-dependent oxidoreductase (nitroreductase family)
MLGCEVLLLHTTGRRSGLERTTPLMYTSDGDDIVLVASNGGSRLHPTWYLNLSADPSVRVERKGPAEAWTARTATREEKERLWPGIVDAYKGYAAYERRTDRDIPLVILEKG